jgi:hypothetical protein
MPISFLHSRDLTATQVTSSKQTMAPFSSLIGVTGNLNQYSTTAKKYYAWQLCLDLKKGQK